MNFSHYSNRPVTLAVELVNSLGRDHDDLSDAAGLKTFLEDYRDLWDGVAQAPKAAELSSIHALRRNLRAVFEASDAREAAALINKILAEYRAVPRVSLHTGEPHLHFEPVNTSMANWLGAVTAMGLATVIVENGVHRFGVCCASDCDDVYVDSSRNRSRRHCSHTCSNREAVAAHRKRQAG